MAFHLKSLLQVQAEVDSSMRKRSKCNHTATHLLQAALKKVLPNDVAQQGSAVTFDSLRFDFNLDRPMKVLLSAEGSAFEPAATAILSVIEITEA